MAIIDSVNVVQAVANQEPKNAETRKMRRVGPAFAAGLAAGFGAGLGAAGGAAGGAVALTATTPPAGVSGFSVMPVAGAGFGAVDDGGVGVPPWGLVGSDIAR